MRTNGAARWLGAWTLAAALTTALACGDDDGSAGDGGTHSSGGSGHGGSADVDGGGHAGQGHGGSGGAGLGGQSGAEDGGPGGGGSDGGSAGAGGSSSNDDGGSGSGGDAGVQCDADDDNPCTIDACDGSTPTHEPEAERTECDVDGGTLCDGDGACVECVDADDCDGSDVCQSGSCVPEACMNGTPDGDETDEDCGGPDCAPCGPGKACVGDDDCAGQDCTGLSCVANCADGAQNNDEAAVDCGEGCATGCPLGTACDETTDCASGVCDAGSDQCASAGDCFDHAQNGDETDEDCGGPDCDPCGPNLMCVDDADCEGDDCGGGDTCVPNCSDTVQNNTEVDVDCGPGCGTCDTGDDCSADAHCTSGICLDATCTDLNGCTLPASMNLTSMSDVTITQSGTSYSPTCIRVSSGTIVHISNSSSTHPFTGGRIVGTAKTPASTGPFAGGPFTSGALMFTMSSTGNFGFYCNNHGVPSGMKGAVLVVP